MSNSEKINQLIITLIDNTKTQVSVCDLLIDYINTLTDDEKIELIARIPDEVGVIHECDACKHLTLDEFEIYDGGMCCVMCKSDGEHDEQSGYTRF